MRSKAGMANRQGDVDLRFAVRTLARLAWLGLAGFDGLARLGWLGFAWLGLDHLSSSFA
jgi:hypothetical protein